MKTIAEEFGLTEYSEEFINKIIISEEGNIVMTRNIEKGENNET